MGKGGITMILRIYSDGACSGNQNDTNLGGWGAVLEYGQHSKELYGSEANTTNNRMELTAVIEALKALNRDGLTIRVFTDSSYVANCFKQKWYVKWEKNGWLNSQKKPVENPELWKELLALVRRHEVTFYQVKGHVNLSSPNTNVDKHYQSFCKLNGPSFDLEEFRHIIEMNNRADALANIGIDEIRP